MGNKIISEPFALEVSQGKWKQYTKMDKYGITPSLDTNNISDVWEFGGEYIFSDTADIGKISSSSVLDTQEVIVYGLDEEGYEVEEIITLQGRTPVDLPTSLWRIFRMINNAAAGNDINGTVYVYVSDATVVAGVPSEDEKVRAIMRSSNQTLMAIYTIPKGKTGYLFKGQVGMSRRASTGDLTFKYKSRRFGKVFNNKFQGALTVSGDSNFKDDRSFPDKIPELTDIVINVSEISRDDMAVFAAFDILLEDNTYKEG